jgi:hypothetical protein
MEEREQRIKEIRKMAADIGNHCYTMKKDDYFPEIHDDNLMQYLHDMLFIIKEHMELYEEKVRQKCEQVNHQILQEAGIEL